MSGTHEYGGQPAGISETLGDSVPVSFACVSSCRLEPYQIDMSVRCSARGCVRSCTFVVSRALMCPNATSRRQGSIKSCGSNRHARPPLVSRHDVSRSCRALMMPSSNVPLQSQRRAAARAETCALTLRSGQPFELSLYEQRPSAELLFFAEQGPQGSQAPSIGGRSRAAFSPRRSCTLSKDIFPWPQQQVVVVGM